MNTTKITKKDIVIGQAKPMGKVVLKTAPLFDGKTCYY